MSENNEYEVEQFVPTSEEVFNLPLLSDLKGKTFFIKRVEFDESLKGEYAVLDIIENLKKPEVQLYRTSGVALLTQLKGIRKTIVEGGKLVQVRLGEAQGKNFSYYTFVDL